MILRAFLSNGSLSTMISSRQIPMFQVVVKLSHLCNLLLQLGCMYYNIQITTELNC